MEISIPYDRNPEKAGVPTLFEDHVDFKPTLLKRDNDGDYILVRGTVQEEDLTIINIYTPNSSILVYIKQTLMDMKN